MEFFSDLFGGNNKPDIGAMYPDPPKLHIDDADIFLNQVDSLVKQYEDISTGKSMFDAVKYIYEPQKALIDAQYGIGGPSGDVFSAKSGALADLRAGLNKRGLLDAGTSGLLESQLYANRAGDLADLMGQAKQTQRNEFYTALQNLQTLYPQRFDVRNIPNVVDYMNATNQFNLADAPRASAQAAYNAAQGPKTFLGQIVPQIAQIAGGYFGGPVGAQLVGSIFNQPGGNNVINPNLFNRTQAQPTYQSPFQSQYIGTGAQVQPGYGTYSPSNQQSNIFSGSNNNNFASLLTKALASSGSGGGW